MPTRFDNKIKWAPLLQMARLKFGLSLSEFWKMTFAEYFALHDGLYGKKTKPLTRDELKQLEGKWQRR